MNPKHPSPDDPGQPADAGVDPLDLAQVEQQLRRMRPRPPELDVEAILSAARAADPPLTLAEYPNPEQGVWAYRRIGTLAASWACGAIAGALLTFVLLPRGTPPDTSPDVRATLDNELPKMAEAGNGPTPDAGEKRTGRDDSLQSDPPWSRSESRILVMLLDPYRHGGPPYAEERRPLRAGMFALRQAPEGPWRFRHVTSAAPRDWVDRPEPSSDAQQDITTRPAPARVTTREELLRELLNASPESIL